VLRAGVSTRRGAAQSRHALLSVGAHILGAVVNDVPRGRDRYGEYAAYRSGYEGWEEQAAPEVGTNVDRPAANPGAGVPAGSFLDLRRK
jgi:hypothetical protein